MKSATKIKSNSNGKVSKKVHSEIHKHLNQGKTKLVWLEKQLEEKKDQVASLKKKFDEYEGKVSDYTAKNPKKALAIASAAGVLVTAVWSSFRGSKK